MLPVKRKCFSHQMHLDCEDVERGPMPIGFSSLETRPHSISKLPIKKLIPVLIATVIWGKKWKGAQWWLPVIMRQTLF